jgi:hypothetical protein
MDGMTERTARQAAQHALQPTGWIEAILASRCSKDAVPFYRCGSFQPAADAQAVSLSPKEAEYARTC